MKFTIKKGRWLMTQCRICGAKDSEKISVFGIEGGFSSEFSKYIGKAWRWTGSPVICRKSNICDDCVKRLLDNGKIREDLFHVHEPDPFVDEIEQYIPLDDR